MGHHGPQTMGAARFGGCACPQEGQDASQAGAWGLGAYRLQSREEDLKQTARTVSKLHQQHVSTNEKLSVNNNHQLKN